MYGERSAQPVRERQQLAEVADHEAPADHGPADRRPAGAHPTSATATAASTNAAGTYAAAPPTASPSRPAVVDADRARDAETDSAGEQHDDRGRQR